MESTRHQDQIANHTREHYDHVTGRQVHLSEATRVMNRDARLKESVYHSVGETFRSLSSAFDGALGALCDTQLERPGAKRRCPACIRHILAVRHGRGGRSSSFKRR